MIHPIRIYKTTRYLVRRELAIRKLREYLEQRTGRPVSREEALAAHARWRARNPRKDHRLH